MSVIVGNSRASPLSVKTDVDFVAIRPSPQAWKTVEHVQRWVGKLLVQEGITTWSPTPYSLAHLTLYSGFKKAMTESEREKFIARLNTTVAEVDAFEIEIQLADPATQIKRGPFKYVTLHFNNPTLIQLQTKVKKAVHQTILKKELTFEHIDFDKFHKTFVTHLTIGVLDAPNNHLDIDQLNDKKAKTLFSKQLAFRRKIDFQQQSIQLSVSDVELVGVTSLRAQLSERVYNSLAVSPLRKSTPSPSPSPPLSSSSSSPKPEATLQRTPSPPSLLSTSYKELSLLKLNVHLVTMSKKLITLTFKKLVEYKGEVSLATKTDSGGKPFLALKFKSDDALQKRVTEKFPTAKVECCPEDQMSFINLGLSQMTELLGEQGPIVYNRIKPQ